MKLEGALKREREALANLRNEAKSLEAEIKRRELLRLSQDKGLLRASSAGDEDVVS